MIVSLEVSLVCTDSYIHCPSCMSNHMIANQLTYRGTQLQLLIHVQHDPSHCKVLPAVLANCPVALHTLVCLPPPGVSQPAAAATPPLLLLMMRAALGALRYCHIQYTPTDTQNMVMQLDPEKLREQRMY